MVARKLLEKVRSSDLVKAGAIFMIGNIVSQGFNYLYHLVMGRMLGPAEYGVLGSIFMLLYIASFASSSLTNAVSRFTAEYHGKGSQAQVKSLAAGAMHKVALLGFLVALLYALASPFLGAFLHISPWLLIITGITTWAIMANNVQVGVLNGLQRFVWQNVIINSNSILKLVLAVAFVLLSFGVFGAVGGVLAGVVLSIVLAEMPLWGLRSIRKEKIESSRIYRYLPLAVAAATIPILLITTDLLLVKHFMSEHDAGLYAAAGMIGKIIWFGSGFLALAILPKVVDAASKNKKTGYIVSKAVLLTGSIAAAGILVYALLPSFITAVLFGKDYSPAAMFILPMGFAMGLYAVSTVLVQYQLALERKAFIIAGLTALVVQTAGIVLWHSSLAQVVVSVMIGNLLLLTSLLWCERKAMLGRE